MTVGVGHALAAAGSGLGHVLGPELGLVVVAVAAAAVVAVAVAVAVAAAAAAAGFEPVAGA